MVGIRKEKNLPERIARSIIQNEELFIQSLKIFANTSIVGSQGAQSGGSSGGPSGVGNYFRKDGDIVDGVFATRPSIATIADGEIDIRKITGDNYTSKVFLIPESGTEDELNFILGGSAGPIILGAEFPGQWLIMQPIAGAKITINHDISGFGDPTASPRKNFRTPDGNPIILENEQAVLVNFDSTSGQWSFLGTPGTAVAGDSCFAENDLGEVSGAQTIFFNRNRFVRMVVTGNTSIAFDTSEMMHGCWYQVTLEILQDTAGGNTVTFDDAPFENQITPKVYKAGNRYTSIRFYAYIIEEGGTIARIFAFEENQPFPIQFFDGYIQSRLTTDQTGNLDPNDHIEFDLNLATDNTIAVTTGGGQAAGKFTNFEVGHLYQCEAALAIESISHDEPELSFQWYNVSKAQFFGSQARALAMSTSERDSSLVMAKGFFVADAVGDTVEVRIKSQFQVGSIKAGDQSAEQMSYVIIKDCGVAGIENLEGNKIDAPEPTSPDTIGPIEIYQDIWERQTDANVDDYFIAGHASSEPEVGNTLPCMSSGTVRKLRVRVIVDGGGSANFWIRKNLVDDPVGIVLNTPDIGTHESDDGAIDVTFVKDDLISVRWRRNNSNGNFDIVPLVEIEYNEADGVQHWISDFQSKGGASLGFWCPRNGGKVNVGGNNQVDFQARMIVKGEIRDMVYYGTSPSGSDNTPEMKIRKNGIDQVTRTLATGGGTFIQRFTNTFVEFDTDDLLGCTGRCANAASNLEGRMGWKIEF